MAGGCNGGDHSRPRVQAGAHQMRTRWGWWPSRLWWALIGSKIWHVLDSPEEFRAEHWLGSLWDNAGFAWYGGLTFGIAALVLMGWRSKIGVLRTLDLLAPAAAIGYGMGRIGCFLSGDGCYGIAIQPVHIFGFTFRSVGNGISEWDRAGAGPGLSDAAIRTRSRPRSLDGICGGGWASRTRQAPFWASTWR
jgi:hypothetical protein